MSDFPRDNLVRSTSFVQDDEPGDGLTLRGHGAVFNEWTEINSAWEGRFRERIAPGAFRKTLQENGSRVVLQFDHGQHPLIGSLPIGAIRKLREDGQGLYVEARLADNWLVQPVRDAIENRSIDGMSFRFSVVGEKWEKEDTPLPERTITEVKLMELGPVVFPAYTGTDVGVRGLALARSLASCDDKTRSDVAVALTTLTERGAFYSDLRLALHNALIELFPEGDGKYLWVRDFSDEEVVFDLDGGEWDEPGTFRLTYTSDEDGNVTLDEADPEKVIPQTTYTPARDGHPDTLSTGAAAGTPDAGAVSSTEPQNDEDDRSSAEHSGTYTPAVRPALDAEERQAQLARIRALTASA